MYRNTLGIGGRGPSNSVYSPGVSMLFGQMPSYPTTSQASSHSAQVSETKSEVSVASSRVEAPQSTPVVEASAPVRTYEPTPVVQEAHVETRAPEPTQSAATSRPEPVQRKEWNIRESKPASSDAHKTDFKEPLRRYHTSSIEDAAPSGNNLSLGALAESYKHNKNFRATKVNERALPPTELQARLVYRQHRGDLPSTHEISEALQEDIRASKAELAQAHVHQQHELGQELSAQVRDEYRRKDEYKQAAREAHHASPGFDFEFYTRHPKMVEENKKAGQFVKSQVSEEHRRKQQAIAESRELPSKVSPPSIPIIYIGFSNS